ncbi:MAG: thiol-specific antioxidant related protein/peroxidoxin BcpB [Rhodoglobus sp.]|jgi:DNA-binding transcriptional MerR regulator|nr:thiol-specific antioxidant related protein/peroxidoxin BcpB [Rhodoglobus sp.]
MRIGELARSAGVTTKAVRYYESVGLLDAERLPNGYRDYDEYDVRLVREVRSLATLGIKVEQAKPFLECLVSGRDKGDDCAAPLVVYRSVIEELDERIADLSSRRESVAVALAEAERRSS